MRSESQIREDGIDYQNARHSICFYRVTLDLLRELIEKNYEHKKEFEQELWMELQKHSIHPPAYKANMKLYLQNKMALDKSLYQQIGQLEKLYDEQVKQMSEHQNQTKPEEMWTVQYKKLYEVKE